ncbi:MAG: rRNA maturation RNase YbeY [Cyclobacteriaceae bacterium]|jgi:rRNA maturation RNase YbeY|nr:rRNA maturation RNase YbeY [Cyclobacteriaceae bacterium]
MPAFRFFSDGVDFAMPQPRKTATWLMLVATRERRLPREVVYIFCSDDYLLGINQRFLKHTTYTDIVTFDYGNGSKELVGEVYISLDRVRENAKTLNVSFEEEMRRVVVHGLLHLCGHRDKTKAEKAAMRKKEDRCLSLWKK